MSSRSLRDVRPAALAGSWYELNPPALSHQIDGWLDEVPSNIDGVDVPLQNARVIIAP